MGAPRARDRRGARTGTPAVRAARVRPAAQPRQPPCACGCAGPWFCSDAGGCQAAGGEGECARQPPLQNSGVLTNFYIEMRASRTAPLPGPATGCRGPRPARPAELVCCTAIRPLHTGLWAARARCTTHSTHHTHSTQYTQRTTHTQHTCTHLLQPAKGRLPAGSVHLAMCWLRTPFRLASRPMLQ